ncbi:hypothetical protein QJS10_CPA05g00965 [Acorus calamus]|uniref:Uncharacterized protein n=1 Tax=Acorus calamus TaxID=4465 RepID=A0AAV9EXQ4_ACOCL|nr:hypothetical protein QJS10_CPA05g00965 [Acorus calamus]
MTYEETNFFDGFCDGSGSFDVKICDGSDDEASVDRRPSLPSPAVMLCDLLDSDGGDLFRIRLSKKVEEVVDEFSVRGITSSST